MRIFAPFLPGWLSVLVCCFCATNVVGQVRAVPGDRQFRRLSFASRFYQSTATLQGRVLDQNGGVIMAAEIDTAAFTPVAGFGNLGRNVVIGPGFNNVNFSVLKTARLSEGTTLQFREEVFDLFNHPSFGQPGRVVGSATFGRITNTRFPTGIRNPLASYNWL